MTNWLSRYDEEMAAPPDHVAALSPEEREKLEAVEVPIAENSSNERKEKALERFEENVEASRWQRWEHRPQWAENEQARKVNPMHFAAFISRLADVGVHLEANNFSRVGRIGINGYSHGIFRTITTLQFPYSYEFSVMRWNEYGVPTNEKFRGWRTALLDLIRAGAVTKDQAYRAFGHPTGPVASSYMKELQNIP